MARGPGFARDLAEVIIGYGLIMFAIWVPEFPQRILSPLVLIVTLALSLIHISEPTRP